MEVIECGRVPIYEVECFECHSKIRYKRSETTLGGYIYCPVCGQLVFAGFWREVDMEDENEDS